jgi:hypothetical protein
MTSSRGLDHKPLLLLRAERGKSFNYFTKILLSERCGDFGTAFAANPNCAEIRLRTPDIVETA